MARKCKCKICGKSLTTDIAYLVNVDNKNKYYCDFIEYETYIEENICKKNIYEGACSILGYKSKNTVLFKEINNLHELYTYKDIYGCLNEKKDSIYELIKINNIDKEYNKIRYIFGTISRSIQDYSQEQKKILNNKIHENIKLKSVTEIEKDTICTEDGFKYKPKKNIDFSNLF